MTWYLWEFFFKYYDKLLESYVFVYQPTVVITFFKTHFLWKLSNTHKSKKNNIIINPHIAYFQQLSNHGQSGYI